VLKTVLALMLFAGTVEARTVYVIVNGQITPIIIQDVGPRNTVVTPAFPPVRRQPEYVPRWRR
jgi:hypothetical protein